MKEKTFQSKFNKWCKINWFETSVFELKVSTKDSIPFNVVKPHQIRGLKMAQKKLIYKIEDSSYGQKPFDCFTMVLASAYVVIMYYTKRGTKSFYLITVDDFVKESENSKRKSLTEERASEICDIKGCLK